MGTYTGTISVKANQGQLVNVSSTLDEQVGSVVVGTVLSSNGLPINGAAAILSYINSDTKEVIPISFMFTDMNGQFTFTLKNPSWDYIINIAYSDEL